MSLGLGLPVRDSVTGFAGITTGRAEYLTGCVQVLVAPPTGADGAFRSGEWFDEQRLVRQEGDAVVLDNGKTPGPDRPAPKR